MATVRMLLVLLAVALLALSSAQILEDGVHPEDALQVLGSPQEEESQLSYDGSDGEAPGESQVIPQKEPKGQRGKKGKGGKKGRGGRPAQEDQESSPGKQQRGQGRQGSRGGKGGKGGQRGQRGRGGQGGQSQSFAFDQ
ncbi:PREDICTED: H/ACA ribonucleoprotein complex subunit 1-like isoform X2 [Chinchilla lanigera]|uniref:H/ACA ribonucleoprotein complex subunit 1-like isoform X2 n=1 Tax=Chinchilla lanigera TaxID=34839 RepID=UPI00038EA395|nr:PREDICTED: H/ACA ribonucleoprotein complex subunit 1-like isoform X2 [Chinchilla lanigera]